MEDPGGKPISSEGGSRPAASETAPAQVGRLPDFYIVGHQKCGTSALYAMLRGHPEIFIPRVKELRYFASDMRAASGTPPRGRPRTLEDYTAWFEDAEPGQRIGDASPQYLSSRVAAAAIADVRPDAKIIAILREPASFIRSFHLQMLSSGIESERSLRKALALEPARREGRDLPRDTRHPGALMYSRHVHYVQQLERYYDVFPAENILVLIYDDFRANNDAEVRRVLRFLGVDDSAPIEQVSTAPSKAVRAPLLQKLANEARMARLKRPKAGPLGRTVNALTPDVLRSDAIRARWRRIVYSEPPPADEDVMREMRRRFKPEVLAASEYLDRDLVTLWGYDQIA
jgi:hypothetical protein